MKVICPECASEFDVPVSLISEGRRVRCSTCGNIWFAEVTNDTGGFGSGFGRFDESMDIEPIPDSVHPDDDGLSHDHDGPGLLANLDTPYLAKLALGFGLAAAILGLLLGIGMVMGLHKGALSGLYAPFGLAGAVSETLEISNVVAQDGHDTAGQPQLLVKGKIRNTGDHESDVPSVEITTLSESGVTGDSVRVKADPEKLPAGQEAVFEAEIPGTADPKGRVHVKLVP